MQPIENCVCFTSYHCCFCAFKTFLAHPLAAAHVPQQSHLPFHNITVTCVEITQFICLSFYFCCCDCCCSSTSGQKSTQTTGNTVLRAAPQLVQAGTTVGSGTSASGSQQRAQATTSAAIEQAVNRAETATRPTGK